MKYVYSYMCALACMLAHNQIFCQREQNDVSGSRSHKFGAQGEDQPQGVFSSDIGGAPWHEPITSDITIAPIRTTPTIRVADTINEKTTREKTAPPPAPIEEKGLTTTENNLNFLIEGLVGAAVVTAQKIAAHCKDNLSQEEVGKHAEELARSMIKNHLNYYRRALVTPSQTSCCGIPLTCPCSVKAKEKPKKSA